MNIEMIRKQLDSFYANNKLEEGYQFLLTNLEIAMHQQEDVIVLGILSEILGYLRVTGQFEQGHTIALKADSLVTSLGLEGTLAGATTYLNIATFYSISKQYDLAANFYKKTKLLYEKEFPTHSEQLASLYNNLSIFYQQTNNYKCAYEYQQKAISIITTLPNCEIEVATSYTNLAEICYSMKQYEEGLRHVTNSVSIFKKVNDQDPHYCATLATYANGLYHLKKYSEALQYYDQALVLLESIYGKSENYQIVLRNKQQVEKEYQEYQQKGMYLCKQYFEEIGYPALQKAFPAIYPRMTIGLIGLGSECFGHDDKISHDHDFGPGFCIWLEKEEYQQYGQQVQAVYDALPATYKGYTRNTSLHGGNRVGVFETTSFYSQCIGFIPTTNIEWLRIPSTALATITNGQIFDGANSSFMQIRNTLLQYYPEDVRIKKIVASIAKMAQAGQYNYARCMQRKEYVAASLAMNEFIEATISTIYLLNRTYMPYYKWAHKGIRNVSILSTLHPLLEQLVVLPLQATVWDKDIDFYQTNINTEDKKIECIENICKSIKKELQKQQLTSLDDDFLENHTLHISEKIKDKQLHALHVMEGY